MISAEIRNQIISGKDVNLTLLLIPNYETLIKTRMTVYREICPWMNHKMFSANCAIMLLQRYKLRNAVDYRH